MSRFLCSSWCLLCMTSFFTGTRPRVGPWTLNFKLSQSRRCATTTWWGESKLEPDMKAAADVLLNVNLLCSRQAHANISALTPYKMRRREEALEHAVVHGQRAFVCCWIGSR